MQEMAQGAIPSDVTVLHPAPAVSVIVPTFNEVANLPYFFERLHDCALESGLPMETIVVDDASPDGTGELAEELAARYNGSLRARVVHRPEKLGLSSALYDGIRQSQGAWIAILDADNSHDVRLIPQMLEAAWDGTEVVVGSRYTHGGKIEAWPLHRRLISLGATSLARMMFHLDVRDPMSGFALIRRDTAGRLRDLRNPRSYKLLLEILVRLGPLKVKEVPITFKDRREGDSKLTPREILEFVRLVRSLRQL